MNKKITLGSCRVIHKYGFAVLIGLLLVACTDPDTQINENDAQADSTDITSQSADNSTANQPAIPQVDIPDGFEILQEALGDLDGDQMDEKVIVFNTNRAGEMGSERELHVYVLSDGLWSLWYKAVGPILSSERGGVLGDPFENMSVRNGQIIIDHFGGSIDRWSYSHVYQHIDDNWYMVEASLSYFQLCQYSETYTYNLLNGTGYHSRQIDECNQNGVVTKTKMEVEEALVVDKTNEMPIMNGFLPGDVNVSIKGKTAEYRY